MTQPAQRDQGRSAPDKVGMDQGMRVLASLVAGILLYGALGWVGDHFLHTRFLLPIGIVLGAAFGIYTAIRRLSVTPGFGAPVTASQQRTATTTTKEGDQ